MKRTPSEEGYICDVCGGSHFTLLFDRGRDGDNILNYICEDCSFVFVYPRPSNDELEQLYQKSTFSEKNREGTNPDEKKFRDCEKQALVRYAELKKITAYCYHDACRIMGKALDVGCGTGSFVDILCRNGWTAQGLEPDKEYAENCENHYGIRIHKTPLEDFRSDYKYDLITAFNTIEHVLSPKSFLMKIREILSENGILYIDCPGLDRMHTEIDRFFWRPHINTFSLSSLRELLEVCGFKAIWMGYNPLGFLSAIAVADKIKHKVNESHSANVYRLKSIVDAAYSPHNANANMIFLKPEQEKPVLKLVHIGIHQNTNPGDTLLFPAIRCLLQKHMMPVEFSLLNVRDVCTDETIDFINQHDGVIIGGGGLFLRDTNQNNVSGWQWACPEKLMEKIRVPIIVFAVGYNRFRGQEDFDEAFSKNVSLLVEKSAFFSLRNSGSIEAVKQYIPSSLHHKLMMQPCPTTLLSRFYPYEKKCCQKNRIALNLAFDREDMRYSFREPYIFDGIAQAIRDFRKEGYSVLLYNHINRLDSQAAIWLSKFGISVDQLYLDNMPPNKVIDYYQDAELVFATRGHAHMIPFGINRPVFSLISHDKLSYFLEDTGLSEYGEEVTSASIMKRMLDFIHSNREEQQKEMVKAQDHLWAITKENLRAVQNAFMKRRF